MRRSDPWQQQAAELSLGSMFVKIKTLSQGHTALDWLAWDNQIRITARYQAYNLWEDIFKCHQAFPGQHYQHHDMTIRQSSVGSGAHTNRGEEKTRRTRGVTTCATDPAQAAGVRGQGQGP